jgi:putative ATP-grasp target RiPP
MGFGGGAKYNPPPPTPVPAPAPAPTIDAARQAQMQNDNSVARMGRAASILTSTQGDMTNPTTKKVLLGS